VALCTNACPVTRNRAKYYFNDIRVSKTQNGLQRDKVFALNNGAFLYSSISFNGGNIASNTNNNK